MFIACSLLLVPSSLLYAIDGEETVTGGGVVKFTGAAEKSWVMNTDGSIDLLLKYTVDSAATSEFGSTFTLPGATKAQILMVGGGGGGGGASRATSAFSGNYGGGGGGGAGGFLEFSDFFTKAVYSVTVGKGGAGGTKGTSTTAEFPGSNGDDTTILKDGADWKTAYGGGGGGGQSVGNQGGSGGGGSMKNSGATTNLGGKPKPEDGSQGCAGGSGNKGMYGGGGGGAGGAGADASTSNPTGGVGRASFITGEEKWFAGGGGGGWADKSINSSSKVPAEFKDGILGGKGGGGNGGIGRSTGINPTPGDPETGGGGGGCNANNVNTPGGAAGGSGVVYIRISLSIAGSVKRPEMTDLTYTGAGQTLVAASPAYTITLSDGTELPGDYVGTNVATYAATVALKFTGLEWEGGGSEPVDFSRRIVKAKVVISDLYQKDWMVGMPEADTPKPTCTVTPPFPDIVIDYTYGDSEEGPFGPEKPTEIGAHWVRAEVTGTANYDGDVATASFRIMNGLGALFYDYVQIEVGKYQGADAPLTNFPYRIKLSEESPVGFLYDRAGKTGDDLAITDADGNPYPYVIDRWKTGGESVLYVRLDELGSAPQSLVLYWKLRPGKSAPTHSPDKVWSDWTKAQADAKAGIPAYDFDLVVRDGKWRVNYFTVQPSITKDEWTLPEKPADGDISDGELKEGSTVRKITDINGNVVSGVPSAGGTYRISVTADDPTGTYLQPLEAHVDFRIIAHPTYDNLHGGEDNLTVAGRVLLVNDDGEGVHQVTDQSYYQTDPKNGIFWIHESPEGEHKSTWANLKRFPGTRHQLCHLVADGSVVTNWSFENILIGNNYDPSLDFRYGDVNCRLPHSSTAKAISDPSLVDGLPEEAGNIVMRNMVGAIVTSQFYTNGVGTVYFDAVNQLIADDRLDDRYRIEFEVQGTNETAWTKCTMTAFKRDNNEATFENEPIATNSLPLCILTPGEGNFYRVCVKLNRRDPVRFRIRRVTAVTTREVDVASYILLDNIIVSYPALDAGVEPYGRYEKSFKGMDVLGQEAAMMTPFPSVGDDAIHARAKPYVMLSPATNVDAKTLIQVTEMHYRWRYEGQITNHEEVVKIWPTAGYISDDPLVFTNAAGQALGEGDVDFWFVSKLDVPSYAYHDYSGSGAGLTNAAGKVLYTEAINERENRMSEKVDWFFRLRQGKSDWERFRVLVKTSESDDSPTYYEGVLAGDHVWNILVPTPEKVEGGIYVRFEGANRQTPGAADWAENEQGYQIVAEGSGEVTPWATGFVKPGEGWTRVVCDAATGYLMFRVDDAALSYSVVHADRQDFNFWSDANKADGKGLFVGTSSDTNSPGMSGSSSLTREFKAGLDFWHLSVPTNPMYWTENFTYDPWNPREMDKGGKWEAYKPFESKKTPHGWTTGPGQWVAGYYRNYDYGDDSRVGMALQMQGQGKGYLQFVDSAEAPRGLESISLRARISQSIRFSDISYYDAGKKESKTMTDYTFYSRAAFDLVNRTGFSGNGSLSLVAFMTSDGGCYEFRVEQYGATVSTAGDVSPDNRFRLSLLRWSYDATSGELAAEELGSTVLDYASASTKPLTTNGSNGNYGGLFLSVKNDASAKKTYLVAGISRGVATKSTVPGTDFDYVYCTDTNTAKRLTYGTYGAMCANCPGTFVCPAYYNKSVTSPGDSPTMVVVSGSSATRQISGTKTSCYNDMNSDYWTAGRGRMTVYASNTSNFGLQHVAPQTELLFYKAPAGSTAWEAEPFKKIPLSSFASSEPIKADLWTKDDCSVKIAAGGSDDTSRVDITVDDIELRQWRGEDYDENGWSADFPTIDVSRALPEEFVFMQGWMLEGEEKDGSVRTNCQLSAKRSLATKPLSIRSPLMDGQSGRGFGLGMISFTYENAATNVNLLVQIATNNVGLGNLETATRQNANGGYWTTVTNFSFAGLSEAELKGGVRSQYLGLHGVAGAMRIIMDPDVIRSATNDDVTAFGSIDITSVICRDEPKLDQASWWGWNIRTTDEIARRNLWDNDYIDDARHGLSFALNNSVYDDIRKDDPVNPEKMYPEHLPFLQTPTFQGDTVGELSFKARRYDAGGADARVTLYGAKAATVAEEKDSLWTPLGSWVVTNDTFETYVYRPSASGGWTAFRLVVTGVAGIQPEKRMDETKYPTEPCVRVLIDDVLVTESVRATLRFRNVGAFRSGLDTLLTLTNVTDRSQQPLVGEAWGVQGEIYASQFGGDIDLSTAKVRLWWYENVSPWGFDNWRSNSNAQCVWLARCEDSNTVFRSSYLGTQGSVMPAQQKAKTVQFMLEAVYRDEYGEEATATLVHGREIDWEKPRWYDPLDYNAGRPSWSAYTILDTVAPGWAWINEVNIFGTWKNGWNNSDKPLQFLEIAAPGDADLKGWKIRFLDALTGSDRIVTNEVATFGDNIPGKKKDLKGMDEDSKFVFHVLGSPIAESQKTLDPSDGRLDGTWKRTSTEGKQMQASGEVVSYYPLSIQLVRPSGIVEHEVTAIGTNHYWDTETAYRPETHVDYLNDHEPGGGHFVYVGADDQDGEYEHGWSKSLGVHRGNGGIGITLAEDIGNYWNNVHTMTPGRLNGDQVIDPNYPKPQGDSIVIYSILKGPHIRQTFGNMTDTNATATLVFRKGDPNGTNILYSADRWYQLGEVTENGKKVMAETVGTRLYSLRLGKYASNDITVVANEAIDEKLVRDYGLGPDNRYRDAVMDWLTKGVDAAGRAWHNPEADTVGLADYVGADASVVVTNLDLTTMYWLDIDPTWDDHVMRYRAYFSQPPIPFDAGGGLTNVTLKVFMQISNTVTTANWAPYILRSATVGKTSWDYLGPRSGTQWGDVSFKVTGILVNGPIDSPGMGDRKNWLPLRWFVFSGGAVPDGAPYSASFDENFESEIEIIDPYSKSSPGYNVGWYDWVQEHGWCPVFWAWDIDDRARPESIEILKPDSTFTK